MYIPLPKAALHYTHINRYAEFVLDKHSGMVTFILISGALCWTILFINWLIFGVDKMFIFDKLIRSRKFCVNDNLNLSGMNNKSSQKSYRVEFRPVVKRFGHLQTHQDAIVTVKYLHDPVTSTSNTAKKCY